MKLKIALILTFSWVLPSLLTAQAFRDAPASATAMTNPLRGDSSAAGVGKRLYSQNCAQCHGNSLQGVLQRS